MDSHRCLYLQQNEKPSEIAQWVQFGRLRAAGLRHTPGSALAWWSPGGTLCWRRVPQCGCSPAMLHLFLPMSRGVCGSDERRMHNGNRQQRQATGCTGRERGRKGSGSSLQNRDTLVTSNCLRTKQGHLGVLANTLMCLVIKRNTLQTMPHRNLRVPGELCPSHGKVGPLGSGHLGLLLPPPLVAVWP